MKDDSSFWVEESSGQFCLPMKRKRQRPKRLEFIRWGSRPLIQFLESIGKDTSKPLNRYEVTAIVNEYVNAKNLASPGKKKKIICDEWLLALFGKKSVSRIKIYDLLETHFAENRDSSEDDFQYSSEEQDYGATNVDKKASHLGSKPSSQKKKVPENPNSCFAAVCSENIKLVYLKKTLVQDLLKAQESFEDKVIGSFVRIKSDPNDYLQKHSYQLQQVVGVRMISEADNDGKVHLQLSNCMNEIPIEMLSDNNFSEAECEDLRERVKAGLLRWPTFVELEAKARMLHKDIMKHWIPRELSFLQKLIDQANEKGRRREFFDHLERRKLLEKSSEQERLIAEIPKVIAEKLEPQATPLDTLEMGEEDTSSPRSCNWEASDNYYSDDAGCRDIGIPSAIIRSNSVVPEMKNTSITTAVASKEAVNDWQNSSIMQNGDAAVENNDESSRVMQGVDLEDNEVSPRKSGREVKPTPVIELSDDDDDDELEQVKMEKLSTITDCVWQYVDPQGVVQGPFSLTSLKRWNDANYFDPGFMVWKTGQSRGEAVLLVDALQCAFSCK